MHDADALAGDLDGLGDLHRIVVHQHHVGGLDSRVAAHRAHSDADVRAGEHGRVVDAVADEGELRALRLGPEQLLDPRDLIGGQQLRADLIHPEVTRHIVRDLLNVASEHDGLGDARRLERGDGVAGMGLFHIGDDDVARVLAVHRDMDDGADTVALVPHDAQLLHQLAVSGGDGHAVHHRGHAAAAVLLNVRDAGAIQRTAGSLLQTLADGVRGRALGKRRVFEQLFLRHRAVMHGADLKHALRERAGLVEHDGLRLGEGLEVVGALDEYALLARAAEASEEAERDTDDERAGAGDDEEGQRTVDPGAPVRVRAGDGQRQRRQNGERERAVAHGGGVGLGKAGNEALGAGLVAAGIFHQLQNFGNRGFAERLRCANLQNARHIDAAADDLVARAHIARQALAGQRGGVERGDAVLDHAVDGHLFTRLDNDGRADGDVVGVDLFELTVVLDVRIVGTDIHERGDAAAGLADRIALEQLADLIKEHNGDGLGVVAAPFIERQRDGTDGRNRHEKIFVEHLPVADALPRLAQDVAADRQVGREIECGGDEHRQGNQFRREEQHRRGQDAIEHLFLFLRHGKALRRSPPRGLSPGRCDLQVDLAVVLDLFAVLQNGLHHGLGVLTVGKFHRHLLRHEVDHRIRDALGLLRGILHQIRAVGAVHFDRIGLFHPKMPLSFLSLKQLSTCLILMAVLY